MQAAVYNARQGRKRGQKFLTWKDFYQPLNFGAHKLKRLEDYHEDIKRFKDAKKS